MKNHLQLLRELMRERSPLLSMARITEILPQTEGREVLECEIEMISDGAVLNVTLAWPGTGVDRGIFFPPKVDDWVIVAFVDKQVNFGYIIARLSNTVDKVPAEVFDGHAVLRSNEGKNLIAKGTKILLGQAEDAPAENFVLGQVFKTYASSLLEILSDLLEIMAMETHISSAPGGISSPPQQAAQYQALKVKIDNLKQTPIDDDKILSDFIFGEKGVMDDSGSGNAQAEN